MRISSAATYTLAALVGLTLLAGCGSAQMAPTSLAQSGAAGSIQRPGFQRGRLNSFLAMHGGSFSGHGVARRSFMDRRAAGKPLVFVSYGDAIDIYLQGGKNKIVGQITSSIPIGEDLATDTAGNLYSANLGASSSSVTIYAPPYTKGPRLTLKGRTSYPIAVSRQGTVAVFGCTIPSGTQCGVGFLFYAGGSTIPCATVLVDTSRFSNGIFGAAFDHEGNLYFDSDGFGTAAPLAVGKIAGGCKARKAKTLTTTNALAYAGEIKIDNGGRIAILAATGANPYTVAIETYNPPKKGSLGSPVSTTPLPPGDPSGTFAFQSSGRGLWAGYEGLGPSYASGASDFAYPAGGGPKKTVIGPPESEAIGVAVTPALVP